MADAHKTHDSELPEFEPLVSEPEPELPSGAAAGAAEQDAMPDDGAAVESTPPAPLGGLAAGTPEGPVERVRFTVPAVLSFPGYAETFDVSVVNLSVQGVACSGPRGLAVGEHLQLHFRLNLASDPEAFACQVLWVQEDGEQSAHYGLRFVELSAELAALLAAAVAERVEGRAGDWPMPIFPTPQPAAAAPAPASRLGTYLSVAAGMAAGIGLTLALVALTMSRTTASDSAPAPAASDAPEVAPGGSDAMLLPPPAPAAPAPEVQPKPAPSVATSTRPGARAERGPAAGSAPPAATVEGAPPPLRTRKIGLLRVEEGATQLAMTLLADGPVAQHSVFWLKNPQRLVVDIPGRQSGFASKLFDVGHPLVSRVRVGTHPGKVRFVIETGSDVAPRVASRQAGRGVRVEVHKK